MYTVSETVAKHDVLIMSFKERDQSSVPIPSYPGPSDPRPFSATSSAPSPGAGIAPGSSAAPPSDPAAGAGTAPPPAVINEIVG